MANPLFNLLIVKTVADQRGIEPGPGPLIASAVLPGVLGIALPLILLQSETPMLMGGGGGEVVEDLTTVPDVSEAQDREAARKLVTGKKLVPVIKDLFHEDIAKDEFIDQDPPAGRSVPVGSEVIIRFSLGPGSTAAGEEIHEEIEAKIEGVEAKLDTSVQALQKQITDTQTAIIAAVNAAKSSAASARSGSVPPG